MSVTSRSNVRPVAKPPVVRHISPIEQRPEPECAWDDEYRWGWIAENAYYRAQQRGFEPGHEAEDWLEAEREFELLEQRPRGSAT